MLLRSGRMTTNSQRNHSNNNNNNNVADTSTNNNGSNELDAKKPLLIECQLRLVYISPT